MGFCNSLPLPVLCVYVIISIAFFCLGKQWSQSDGFSQLLFFSRRSPLPYVHLSPNFNKTFNVSAIINSSVPDTIISSPPDTIISSPPHSSFSELRPSVIGLIDKNGSMTDDFGGPQLSPDQMNNLQEEDHTIIGQSIQVNSSLENVKHAEFPSCTANMTDYIPCLDNIELLQRLKSTKQGEKYERHCPEQGRGLDCLIPAPKSYRKSIPWPQSRDEVWFSNVPHPRLVEDKGGQNWISIYRDKFQFPGGGTQFIHGADQYLNQISQMVPEISFGTRTRVVLDVGCGVASFGAFLLSRDVITLSIAPKDVHENQIQFALERGVPAMVAVFATHRLLYPSQAFDLIHCSRCRINWTRDGGILLLEVNRMLRADGYFVWAAQPVYKHEEAQQEAWREMKGLTDLICWELVSKQGYVAVWRKPSNNSCYLNRRPGSEPPLCDPDDNPDNVWYVDLKACITRLPNNGFGASAAKWPDRLHFPPGRLQEVHMDAFIAKRELFMAEERFWNNTLANYIRVYKWRELQLRNVMDMRAVFGGFAAALIDLEISSWVMNVVPISGPDTLPVIYDRGLIGVAHDWCEPFDTYPRSYDLLHASGLFSIELKRCNISAILLEMDRMLRPGGYSYIRDSKLVIEDVKRIATTMRWKVMVRDTSEGLYSSQNLLICSKPLH